MAHWSYRVRLAKIFYPRKIWVESPILQTPINITTKFDLRNFFKV